MSLARRSLALSWWSLPLGLVEGSRVAQAGLLHNSIFAASFRLRALASAAVVVLFYALAMYLVSLISGFAGRLLLGERAVRKVEEVSVVAVLEAGLLLVLFSGGVSPGRAVLFSAILGSLGLGAFLIRRRAPGRGGSRRGP